MIKTVSSAVNINSSNQLNSNFKVISIGYQWRLWGLPSSYELSYKSWQQVLIRNIFFSKMISLILYNHTPPPPPEKGLHFKDDSPPPSIYSLFSKED